MSRLLTSDPTRRAAFVAGVFYLLTFIGSIPGSMLLPQAMSGANYITGAGSDAPIGMAAVFEMVNVLACIGTAVALFSVLRRQHESLALGFVATRLFEAAVIVVGVVSIMAVASLRLAVDAGTPVDSVVPVSTALVAVRDWTVLIGPGMAAFNALMFGTLLYRARLVPRAIPALGILGAPLLISFVVGMMLGIAEPFTPWQVIAVAPFFIWELVIGLWMTFKGFNTASPIIAAMAVSTDIPATSALVAAKSAPA